MWSEQFVSVDSMPQHRQKHLYYSPCGWGLGVAVESLGCFLLQASADFCLVQSLLS